MGAPKEGRMSLVKNQIYSVLSKFYELQSVEDDDEEEFDCDLNSVPTTLISGKVEGGTSSSSTTTTALNSNSSSMTGTDTCVLNSNSNNNNNNNVNNKLFQQKRTELEQNLEGKAQDQSSNSFEPSLGSREGKSGGSSPRRRRANIKAVGQQLKDSEARNVTKMYLQFVSEMVEKLRVSEAKREALEKERSQLMSTLESERKDHANLLEKYVRANEQKSQFETRSQGQEVTIMNQHSIIQKLKKDLQTANVRKSVSDKETCTTPLPSTSTGLNSTHFPGDGLDGDAPSSKRIKLEPTSSSPLKNDFGGDRTSPSKKLDNSPTSTQSLASIICKIRAKKTISPPPQLSPAVTPKPSTLRNISSLASSTRGTYLGAEADDEIGPPDEFQDELERITGTHRHSFSSFQPGSQHGLNNLGIGGSSSSSQFRHFPSSSNSTSASAFSRPNAFPRPQPSLPLPSYNESRRRFIPKSLHNRQSLPQTYVPSSSSISSTTSSSVPKNSFNLSDSLSSTAISPRDNSSFNARSRNFLNRPLPRKPPGVSLSSITTSTDELRHFRSLDSTATSSSGPLFGENDMHGVVGDLPPISSSTATPAKKRAPGRPPGSLSKFKTRLPASASSSSSSTSGGRASTSRLSNGMSEEPAPPQRFSQRGRLLKPNRARYSPDPDGMSSTRENKYLTTRKNYLLSESFVSEASIGSGDGTTLMGMEDTESSMPEKPSVSGENGEDGEPVKVVEVPKWRTSILEGYLEGEERVEPDDDMSDEAFLKRHQKLEAKEKQRKRWDSQRIREETYLERLKRKQEERERLKELRRQQRKRKGRCGASEEESVMPSSQDIRAIYVSDDLPVGAFGHSLPIVEKVAFRLLWIPSFERDPASESPFTIIDNDDNVDELSLRLDKEIENVEDDYDNAEAVLDKAEEMEGLHNLDSFDPELPHPTPLLKVPRSCSSLSAGTPEREMGTPPPPKIYRMGGDVDDDEYYSSSDDDEDRAMEVEEEEMDKVFLEGVEGEQCREDIEDRNNEGDTEESEEEEEEIIEVRSCDEEESEGSERESCDDEEEVLEDEGSDDSRSTGESDDDQDVVEVVSDRDVFEVGNSGDEDNSSDGEGSVVEIRDGGDSDVDDEYLEVGSDEEDVTEVRNDGGEEDSDIEADDDVEAGSDSYDSDLGDEGAVQENSNLEGDNVIEVESDREDEDTSDDDDIVEVENMTRGASPTSPIPSSDLQQNSEMHEQQVTSATPDSTLSSSTSPVPPDSPYTTVELVDLDESSNDSYDEACSDTASNAEIKELDDEKEEGNDNYDDERVCSSSSPSTDLNVSNESFVPTSSCHSPPPRISSSSPKPSSPSLRRRSYSPQRSPLRSLPTPALILSRIDEISPIRCPKALSSNDSGVCVSSSSSSSLSSSETTSSKASITFFIPKNPLAPRSSSTSKSKASSSSSTTTDKFCKDRNIRS